MIYCSSCGKRALQDMKFCPSCGQKLESNTFALDDMSEPADDKGPRAGVLAVQKDPSPNPRDIMEPVFYSSESGLCITRTLLVIPAKAPGETPATYPIKDIVSFKAEKDISARIIGIVGVVFGVVLMIAHNLINMSAAMGIGTVLVVFGILMSIFIHPSYHFMITTPNGEIEALKMGRKHDMENIMAALTKAMAK